MSFSPPYGIYCLVLGGELVVARVLHFARDIETVIDDHGFETEE